MDAKFKAKELVEKYYSIVDSHYISIDRFRKEKMKKARQCATICVDEIIASRPTHTLTGVYFETLSDRIDEAMQYWESVRDEIAKL